MPPYQLLKSEMLYTGRAFTIRGDSLRLPNGNETRLDIVVHSGSITILPVDSQGNLLFIRQYRHAAGLDLLELPAGALEKDEAPEDGARRELREETGMTADRLVLLGGFYLAPGYSTEYMNVFLATDLRFEPLKADADEFLALEKIPIHEAMAMVTRGEIPDAKTLAAFYLAKEHLEKQK